MTFSWAQSPCTLPRTTLNTVFCILHPHHRYFLWLLQALVATTDSVDAFSLLQNMAPMSYDSSRLIDVACISFSSTDRAHLARLQAKQRQTVLAQFAVSCRQ